MLSTMTSHGHHHFSWNHMDIIIFLKSHGHHHFLFSIWFTHFITKLATCKFLGFSVWTKKSFALQVSINVASFFGEQKILYTPKNPIYSKKNLQVSWVFCLNKKSYALQISINGASFSGEQKIICTPNLHQCHLILGIN